MPEKQNITTQGNPGHTYVMLREGAALITAYDNYGRERPRSRLQPRSSYGKTSLFKGSLREVTVRAVRGEAARGIPGVPGADVISLDRRDFLHAIAERPDLWKAQLLARQIEATKEVKPEYAWMQEGEAVKWSSRPHILWLIWPLGLILSALLALVIVVLLLPPELAVAGDVVLFLLGGFLVLVGIFAAINYYDDYYVVTNRRVTRRDRQLVFFEARAEAPVEMIQDVTINSDFWGRIFDFGDVTIRTASKGGAIQLEKTPQPYKVKELLEAARTEAQADERGRQKEELRRGLIKDLHLALPVPQRQRALGDAPLPRAGSGPAWFARLFRHTAQKQRVPTPPSTQAWLAQHSSRLPNTWRKALVGTAPVGDRSEGAARHGVVAQTLDQRGRPHWAAVHRVHVGAFGRAAVVQRRHRFCRSGGRGPGLRLAVAVGRAWLLALVGGGGLPERRIRRDRRPGDRYRDEAAGDWTPSAAKAASNGCKTWWRSSMASGRRSSGTVTW